MIPGKAKDLIVGGGVQVWEVGLGEDLYLLTKPGWTAEARRKWGPGGGEGWTWVLIFSCDLRTTHSSNNKKPSPHALTALPDTMSPEIIPVAPGRKAKD